MALDTIFISHAIPEDNEFVRWLGSRLTGQGYKVWAELLESGGGSPLWSTIESIIRERTVKFLSVASKSSVLTDRRGFRNELALADARGRTLNDNRFIIPLRFDEMLIEEFPAQLSQLHYIDFAKSWGDGLLETVRTLERLNVPKSSHGRDQLFDDWRAISEQSTLAVENANELALTNLVKVVRPPTTVRIFGYQGDPNKFPDALKRVEVPHAAFYQLVVSLAEMGHLQSRFPAHFTLQPHSEYTFDEFVSGHNKGTTRPDKTDAKNMVTAMLRASIEQHLRSRGLVEFTAGQQSAFFFPKDLLPSDKVYYDTVTGKRTWKKVVGHSKRMRVHWHLAMKVNVVVKDDIVVRFKPYICWSEDGSSAIEDPKRTSVMRKRFCKNWWNTQWRTLQQAFVAFLAEDKPTILIEIDSSQNFALERDLVSVNLVRRIAGDFELVDQIEDPVEPDDIDLDEEGDDETDEEAEQ